MRHEKQFLLDEIKGQLERFSSFVLISHTGLDANKMNTFRRDVGTMKGNVEFVKKTVLVKAADTLGIKLDLDQLPGHIGLILAKQDPIEMTKFVFKFRDENENSVKVVGARIDGAQMNGQDVETLSKLPSKDEMRAQLLAVLEAPLSQTLSVMEALISSVVYCLDNKVKQEQI